MRILRSGLTYFALVFGVGFVLGSIRVPFLVPRLGMRVAELIEMPFMFVAIWLAGRFVIRRFALPPAAAVRLGVGFVGFGLLLATELTLTLLLQDQPLSQFIASRDPVSGSVYLGMLVMFALMPFLLARR